MTMTGLGCSKGYLVTLMFVRRLTCTQGLPSADLMQEDHLREFMVQEQPMWGLDSERSGFSLFLFLWRDLYY